MVPFITTAQVSAIGSLGVALAAGFAAWQGIKNLSAWRRERVGGRRMDLAEEALIQFYQVEHAFKAMRSPLSDSSETADLEEDLHESPAQKRGREMGHTVWKRMQAHNELFQSFYVTGLKLRAVFGEDIYTCCQDIRKCFGRIRIAAQMFYTTPYEGYDDKDFRRKLEADVWDLDSKDPESIEQIVSGAVKQAEGILTPHLQI